MTINIEKMRADQSWKTRKFVLQAFLTLAAVIGATATVTATIVNYVNRHPAVPVAAPPPQIIYLVPGSPPAITPPTAGRNP